MATAQHITELLFKHLSGTLNNEEREQLDAWVNASSANNDLYTLLNDDTKLAEYLELYDPKERAARHQRIWEQVAQSTTGQETPIHTLKPRRRWWPYAAAAAVLVAISLFIWNNNQMTEQSLVDNTSPVPVQNDVTPGGNKAVLTLADGKKLILDSLATGKIAEQGSAAITKRAEGEVVYQAGNASDEGIVTYNTLSTPRGGQFQLQLPDGSRAWLNAASSITYPTAFKGSERRVSITGEAYFEVAHNAKQPFQVEFANATVEVLGTSFNINAYLEEPTINTTLLEGSVRIKTVHTSLKLAPGQQGVLSDHLTLAVSPDLEQVMAWKNGTFVLNNTDLPTIMRQIMRWYDIEVKYEGKIPNTTFGGVISRNLPLSEILDLLKNSGVSFRLEGRTLHLRS